MTDAGKDGGHILQECNDSLISAGNQTEEEKPSNGRHLQPGSDAIPSGYIPEHGKPHREPTEYVIKGQKMLRRQKER